MTTTLYSSRGKLVLFLILSLVFVAGGVLMVSKAGPSVVDQLKAWGVLAFFGLCAVIVAYQLARPSRLDLTADGFTYTGLFNKSFAVRWSDIEAIHIWQNPVAAQRLVAWTYAEGRAPRGAAVSAALGAEGAIPGVWTMSTEQLAALMQDRLEASRK